jgi:DNA-binding beta-propeller fold protein YncE
MTRKLLCGLVGTAALAAACGGSAPKAATPAKQSKPANNIRITQQSCARQHPGVGATRVDTRRQGGAVALAKSASGTIAYIADSDDDAILVMDVDSGATLGRTALDGTPAQLMVLEDGRVAVTLGDLNRVDLMEPAADASQPLSRLCSVATAAEPFGLAATPDDKRVLVTSAFGHRLAMFDAHDMKRVLDKKIAREPRAVVVDDDGKRAFVAHVVGGKVSVVDLTSGSDEAAREIELRVDKHTSQFSAVRQSCQGFALAKSVVVDPEKAAPIFNPEKAPAHVTIERKKPHSPSNKAPNVPSGRVFAPRVTIDPGDPTRSSSGYGNPSFGRMEMPIVSVIDAGAERALTTAATDSSTFQGAMTKGECLLPRAAAMNGANGTLLVTCLGSDTLVEMDARGLDPAGLERRRWQVPSGPLGLALDERGTRAVVWSQFDRKLSIVSLAKGGNVDSHEAPRLVKAKMTELAALGRKVFHRTDDARISRDGRACASCHPDGREDALTWPSPVGARQTLMLAGRVQNTAPYSWMGAHESVKVHLNATFQRLGGTGLPDEANVNDELDALIAYLNQMPAPNVRTAAHESSELVARGKQLFFSAEQGCSSCHVGGTGTDSVAHDMFSTPGMRTSDNAFDTPSLRFVSGTAPYFHDGRFSTLLEVLTTTDARMGHTMHLSRQDALALEAFMGTL